MIDSPRLAQRLSSAFDSDVPRAPYEVRLAADGSSLQWIEQTASGVARFDTEPGTGFLRRLGIGALSLLPIDWLL